MIALPGSLTNFTLVWQLVHYSGQCRGECPLRGLLALSFTTTCMPVPLVGSTWSSVTARVPTDDSPFYSPACTHPHVCTCAHSHSQQTGLSFIHPFLGMAFAKRPIITEIFGCELSPSPTHTAGCMTDGSVPITIRGHNFMGYNTILRCSMSCAAVRTPLPWALAAVQL